MTTSRRFTAVCMGLVLLGAVVREARTPERYVPQQRVTPQWEYAPTPHERSKQRG